MSHSLPHLTLTTSTSSLSPMSSTSPIFPTVSLTHTRSVVLDPYVPRQSGGSTEIQSLTVTATGGHVDVFVFVGREGNKAWEEARKRLQDLFRRKMMSYYNFTHCDVRIEHQQDGGFLWSQTEFVDELREIQIPSHRAKRER